MDRVDSKLRGGVLVSLVVAVVKGGAGDGKSK